MQGDLKAGEKLTRDKIDLLDRKKLFSYINQEVYKGLEIIPQNGIIKGQSRESRKKYEIIDCISDKYFKLSPIVIYDEELKDWTIALDELNLFGEGATYVEAVENLIDCILDYESYSMEQIEKISRAESLENQLYLRRIISCNRDRKRIREELGL
ncbi:MAG: hypothetical protein N2645_01470 [Clostridia bacterium]|nr:hypothetical protein [Clostridia bacterium]